MRVLRLLMCFLSFSVLAETKFTTQIYDIDQGTIAGDEVLVFLTSGHVAKLNQSNKFSLPDKNKLFSDYDWFEITMDSNRYITHAKRVKEPRKPEKMVGFNSLNEDYIPTTVANMSIAKKYHKEARLYAKDSQCFNRAMVWSYEWWKKHSVKSNKILIYWTRNYIRKYNFEWWFHIAPLINVMDEGSVVERVMDIKYTKGPLTVRQWTNIFMRNNAPCQVITKFSEYADYPYMGDCYLQRTSMYTLQPADLQMEEAWGYKKTNFIMDEVRASYLEAFDERI